MATAVTIRAFTRCEKSYKLALMQVMSDPVTSRFSGKSASRYFLFCLLELVYLAGAGCSVADDPRAAFAAGDYRMAARLWEQRAKGGDPDAQNFLGVMQFSGFGVEQDRAAAVSWFARAAIRGNADAQRNLGMMFELGLALPRDNARAIGWYLESRRNGNGHAGLALQALGSEVTSNQAQQGATIVAADLAQQQVSTRTTKLP